METADPVDVRNAAESRSGILYPLMLIAAIAVIVFSVAGIATTMGWMPGVLSQGGSSKSGSASAPAPGRPGAAACADCGVIESIRAVEVKSEASGVGAVGGAVVGGIPGNQVGRGNGRIAATVVGAGAGAYAGHQIEKNAKTGVNYQIRVRMSDGTHRTVYERALPALAIGQKVRVTEQGIVAAG